jgi:hypothetical protein
MDLSPTPDHGPISLDQAVGLLGASPSEPVEREEAAPVEAAEIADEPQSEAEPTADAAPELDEPTGDAESETGEADLPPIAAPQSWDAEAKAKFEALPRDVQEVVAARETDRDKATQRSVQEAADARKDAATAKAEAQTVTQLKAFLDQVIPVAAQTFQNKWSDWTPAHQAEMARTDPAGYVARKAAFEAEAATMAQLNTANQQAQQAAFQQFEQTERAKLATMEPYLFDPKEGPARRQALVDYAVKESVPPDQIQYLDANTLRLLRKAQLWDESQAKARSAATPARPAPAPAAPAVRPAAAQAPSRTRSLDSARARLDQTGSTDDAVALLRARRQGR